jgi:hypothetical protein
MGKGSTPRPVNYKRFWREYERIFGSQVPASGGRAANRRVDPRSAASAPTPRRAK